ncbi:hypothetical protein QQS21_000063 [Conoideocrella luteorostrata]|uniref:MFS general substrate transporter n=1 Tax=Conoideocrella luteorostrata TaxID=1105319 RepID=A0AAJ0CZJ0_9HYPO|nr:hypothetical protein QQS21_000063 [Conoideocrella luteorostrata]
MPSNMAAQDERRPLLPPPEEDEEEEDGVQAHDDHSLDNDLPQDYFAIADRVTVLVLLALAVVTNTIGGQLYNGAMYLVQSDIACHEFQSNATFPPFRACESPEGREELAVIEFWKGQLALLAGLLTAVSYGIAADKFSRRNLLALSIGGTQLSMAGEIIIYGLQFTVFLYIQTLTTVATLVSWPLVFRLTEKNPWLAVYIGLATTCIGTILILFLPATRDVTSLERMDQPRENQGSRSGNFVSQLYSHCKTAAKPLVSAARLVCVNNKRLFALLLAIFLAYTSPYAGLLATFYSIERLRWNMEQASLVMLVKSWSGLVLNALILPIVAQVLIRLRFTPVEKDLWLARGTILAVMVGSLITGLSNSKAVLITGTVLLSPDNAFLLAARSLLAIFNREQRIGMLFSLVATMEIVSTLVGRPFLTWLFKVGAKWEPEWSGLPFFVVFILTGIALIII